MLLSRNSDMRYKGSAEYFYLLKEVGYEAVDLNETARTDLWLKPEKKSMPYFERIVNHVQKAGLVIGQCHAPVFDKGWYGFSQEALEEREECILRCIRGAKKLGIPYTVVHPIIYAWQWDDPDRAKTFALNLRHLERLTEEAEKYDVDIALENLPGKRGFLTAPAQMQEILQQVRSARLFVCLDTGHAFSVGETISAFFALLEDKIKVLHVHDTFAGIDAHGLPYTGIGDWQDFVSALRTYGYSGTLNSESNVASKLPPQLRRQAEILECEVLKELRSRILKSNLEKENVCSEDL